MKKKILLTGASSLLGSKFIELYSNKYNIVSFSKHDPTHPIDLLDINSIKKLFDEALPDIVIHLAASFDKTDPNINEINSIGTENALNQAKRLNIPFVFMSSESVYGGNLEHEDEIKETRKYNPKSDYATSKVKSEELIIKSNLPYLILRGHRFIGFVENYSKSKQFPDTIKSILNQETVHLDSKKIFRPSFLNHMSEIIDFYISNELDKQRILNCVIEKNLSYYDPIIDVCGSIGLDTTNIKSDGEEIAWQERSLLSTNRLEELNYPVCDYEQMLKELKVDFLSIS